MNPLGRLARAWAPPVLTRLWRSCLPREYAGSYATWDEAKRCCTGYEAPAILDQVRWATLKVKRGEAAFERDSVLFDRVQYSWPVLAALLKAALEGGGKLSVLDFGGSLGSHYFQCREFLNDVKDVRWSVVEQPAFARCGREEFQDDRLVFYDDFDLCARTERPRVLSLSGVLQYLEMPGAFLADALQRPFDWVLVDRTPFWNGPDRLTVQKVPPAIYQASYPCWIFNAESFFRRFRDGYRLVAEFEGTDRADAPIVFKGALFRRKDLNVEARS